MSKEIVDDSVSALEKQLKAEKENYRRALTSFNEFGELKQIKHRIKSINSLLFALQQSQELNSSKHI